jgi:hypothetical protein
MPYTCKKCEPKAALNYCPVCGRPKTIPRIDGSYVLQQMRNALSFEEGFLLTVRELLVNPGQSVQEFLREDRNRLVKPIVFLIVTSLIYTLCNTIFQFEDGYVRLSDNKESAVNIISDWIRGNYGWANIIMAVFIGFWIRIFFRKSEYNIFEILILLCFTMGMGMLIYSFFGVIQSVTGITLVRIAVVIGFIYLTLAIGMFYGKRKIFNYVKAFLAYILGMITFSLSAIIIGKSIDFIIKQ